MCDAEENEPTTMNRSQALKNETLLPLMLTLCKIVTYSCKLTGL